MARKTPPNMEWRGETLHGRIRICGKLRRWSLRTGDVEIARTRVAEDIERMKTAAFYGDRPALAVERRKWRNCPTLTGFREPPPAVSGHIYVVGFRDYVKIGWSATVKARLVTLQNHLPENLVVYGVIEGTREEEIAVHHRFRHMRLSREWFRLTGPLEIWVDGGCATPIFELQESQERVAGTFARTGAGTGQNIERMKGLVRENPSRTRI